jgi:tRNA(Ile)-lysidine synthase
VNRIRLFADDEHFLEEELSATEQMDSRERRERKVRAEPPPVVLAPIFSLKTMRPLHEEWERVHVLNGKNQHRREVYQQAHSSKSSNNGTSGDKRDNRPPRRNYNDERQHAKEDQLAQAMVRLAELQRTNSTAKTSSEAGCEQLVASASAFMREYDLLARGVVVACAVSGGVDSMALLDVMFVLSVRFGIRVVVVHCNHLLRGMESMNDAEFVRSATKRYGFGLYSAEVDVQSYATQNRLSTETAARLLRYQLFEYVAFEERVQAVVTGHTLNDSAETFLLNLVRGSGLTGLSGIPPVRPLGFASVLARPLLSSKKETLEQYCRERGIAWREDSTNSLLVYARNRVRHDLLPKLEEYSPAVMETLQRTSAIIREADKFIADIVTKAMPALLEDAETYYPTHLALNVAPLRVHSHFVQSEIIHRAIAEKFTEQFGQMNISHEAVERVLDLLDADTARRADVNKHIYAVRDHETILIAPKAAVHTIDARIERGRDYDFGGWRISMREVERKNVKFSADPAMEYVDAALLPMRLTLRTWRAGDKFQPIGMNGSSMNVSDYLTNSKISFIQRQNILVLASGENAEEIVWVCGMRLSERYKVAPDTKTVLRLEYRPKKQPPPQMKSVPEPAPYNAAAVGGFRRDDRRSDRFRSDSRSDSRSDARGGEGSGRTEYPERGERPERNNRFHSSGGEAHRQSFSPTEPQVQFAPAFEGQPSVPPSGRRTQQQSPRPPRRPSGRRR